MKNLNRALISWSAFGLVIVFAVFLIVSIDQKLNTAATTNTISFSGEGKVSVKPDIAVANLAIVTEAAASKAAQDQNSRKSQAVVDFLKKQGVADKDIKTISYNINPQYKYPQFDRPQIISYQVNQTLEVKIRNFDQASEIIDGVVGAGVNHVNNLSFQIDKPEKLKAETRAKAIADAKNKARELESQIGIKLGKIINFSENSGGYPGPVFYEKAVPAGAGGGVEPSLPSGENEITVNVTLTYQIK